MSKSIPPRSRRLQYEALESRELMAVTAALTSGGILNVIGTESADQINFRQISNAISIIGVSGSWSADQVKAIVVDLRGGNDVVSFQSSANGGNQAIVEQLSIKAGSGTDRVRLANGTDIYLSGAGNTLDVATNNTVKLNGVTQNLSNTLTATLAGGVLTVTGTNGADNLQFRRINNVISIKNFAPTWVAASVTSIVVHLQDGTDVVSLDSVANGGNQPLGIAVTVNSGMGNEKVRIVGGKEASFSGLGKVMKVAAAGTTATLNGAAVNFTSPAPTPPANWFDANIVDTALRSLGKTLYADNKLDRNDIIALLRNAQDNSAIDATELSDLRKIAGNATLFAGLEHVRVLTSYIVNGSAANATYQGQSLGNLAAGSAASVVDKLINKWFLGLDRPTAGGTYRQFAGQLFVSGPSYTDINQGQLGDCYFLASLAEVALRSASTITGMFIVNGDGTYTVRFFNGSTAAYVTVDSFLPTNASGNAIYAGMGRNYANTANELWVMLAEKAYVQANQFGWIRPGLSGNGQNAYSAIEGGYIYAALGHITGKTTTPFASTAAVDGFQTFVTAWTAGKSVGFASKQTPASGSGVVGSHAYAVIGYNATNQTITLYNPWGPNYATLTLTWTQIQASFAYFDRLA